MVVYVFLMSKNTLFATGSNVFVPGLLCMCYLLKLGIKTMLIFTDWGYTLQVLYSKVILDIFYVCHLDFYIVLRGVF